MASVVRNMVNILGIADKMPASSELYKEFSVGDTICLPCGKPDIERLISSAFDAQIISVRVINTPAGIPRLIFLRLQLPTRAKN